jgi:hypothetical protein
MWEPRRLTTLWASTACYRDSFTFINHDYWLPGDLAEVAVYQGPRLKGDLYLGPGGAWNDTMIPRVRYMDQRNNGLWQMTDAEARGGIDGTYCSVRHYFFGRSYTFHIYNVITVSRVPLLSI